MVSSNKTLDLEKQGYRLVGNHSASKVCMWTKKAITKDGFCYKQKFYGIKSHRCVQMTPSFEFCNQRCCWCWRDIEFTKPRWTGKPDDPKEIIDGCIKAQVKYLKGFGGNKKTDKKRYKEMHEPLHFAISLSGEPTFYPRLPELIDEIKKRKMTAFLVTNGTNPEMLKQLINHQPTQIYITLPAPDEETYSKVCSPLLKNQWKKILQSLSLLKKFKRSVIRLTLVKNVNMIEPEKYAALIKKYHSDWVECKAYMHVGYSMKRLKKETMPLHQEIKQFSKELSKLTGLKIMNEKKESRVVLLGKKLTKVL